ncbi:MAG: class I SAM-dependent methyltransferase [Candidatus Bathyarchaeia archaeon]
MSRKTYFNEMAKTWDEQFCTPQLASFLGKLVPQFGLERGQNILDVGTGTGVLIPYLIQAVGPSGSVTAIDYAEKMVQICRSKHSHLKNVTVKLQDVEEDKLPSESFDAVTCFGLFPHLDKRRKALRNMNRALKLGGILIIAHALSSEEIRVHHSSTALSVMNDTLPEKAEIKRLLKRAGFSRIHLEDEHGYYLCMSTKQ